MALPPLAYPPSSGGGGGTPGGSNTQVQYNDSGSFGGDANFTWDKTTKLLTIGILTVNDGSGDGSFTFSYPSHVPTLTITGANGNAPIYIVSGGFNTDLELRAVNGTGLIRSNSSGTSQSPYINFLPLETDDGDPQIQLATYQSTTPTVNLALNRGGSVTFAKNILMSEMTAPSAPAANGVTIYAEDNGSGKTRLMALFSSGAAQQIAIEP